MSSAEKKVVQDAQEMHMSCTPQGNNKSEVCAQEKYLEISRKIRSRHFVWTLFNYDAQKTQEIVAKFWNGKYIFQEEICPKTGKAHLQGFVSFPNAKSQYHIDQILGEGKCRKMEGTVKQNIAYCSKIETRKPGGQIWFKGYEPPKPVEKIIDILEDESKLFPWQKMIIEIIQKEPDDRAVVWIWGPGGLGKSKLQKHLVLKYGALLTGGNIKDAFSQISQYIEVNKTGPKIIMYNLTKEMNAYDIDYNAVESIKDGLGFSSKFKSCMCAFNSPHLLIFANCPPATEKLSQDRWNILELNKD